MYGFETRDLAVQAMSRVAAQDTANRYEVGIYKDAETDIWGRGDKTYLITVTYGVKRFVPYCAAMPERFDGFVWFSSKGGR